jgi:outer membrane biosynthesis protein TonB
MHTLDIRILAALVAALALGCGEKKAEPPPAPSSVAPPPAPESPPATAAPPAQPSAPGPQAAPPAPVATAPKPPVAKPPAATPPPAVAAPKRSEPAAPPAQVTETKPPAVPAPPPAVETAPPAAPPATAHAKVGPDKCKMCHRLQHQSWAASPHPTKGLDCEGCHGNGGDYWPASVMRDRAKATAAGLVKPTLATCAKCHAKADAALFARVHAHKAN